MSRNAIEAVSLSKRFQLAPERRTSMKERFVRGRAPAPRTFWALRDVSFSVPKGSSLGIIGQNGSGKSTALKVLTGIYRPTSGTVHVNGSVSALLEVGAGFHGELTGRENIRLNATILGFTNRQIDGLMDQIIEFADIGEHIDSPLKHYSSGMHVRLGFAVAVMVRPEILIVDEVIAVGDEEFQRKCYDYLFGLRRGGTSLIVVSHGLGQINDLCDEALWLEHGELQEIGPSRSVTSAYIEKVNAREADKAAVTAGSTQAPDEASDGGILRLGSGQVRITKVTLLDSLGDELAVLVTGQEVIFRMHYRASEVMPGVVFGLGFEHESGVTVSGPNSGEAGPWGVAAGEGYVDFAVPRVDLQPGTFDVSVAAVYQGHMFDYCQRFTTLKIRSQGAAEPGLVRMYGSWSIHQTEPMPVSALEISETHDA